jgi:hypothetical protein
MTFISSCSATKQALTAAALRPTRFEKPTAAVSAELTGSNSCDCKSLGISTSGHAPVLAMCRELLQAGVNPDSALAVYRKGVLALRVRSISEGAPLTVKEPDHGRAQFATWKPFPSSPVGSPMRKNRRRAA